MPARNRLLVAALILASAPAAAIGQGMPAGPLAMPGAPGGQNPVLILLSPAVQRELRLDDSQKGRVSQVAQASAARSREMAQSIQSPAITPEQYFDAISRIRLENERDLSQLLSVKQKDRLSQIVLRIEGPIAVTRPEMALRVGLSQAQNQKVQAAMEEFQMSQRRIVLGARQRGMLDSASRNAVRSQTAKLREAANQQIWQALNKKQKDIFNALLGEPFDLSRIDPELPSSRTQATSSTVTEAPARTARRNSGR